VISSVLPLLLSVLLGAGVYLIYDSLTRPLAPRRTRERGLAVRAREFLVRAGLYDVTPRDFILFSFGAGALAGIVAQYLLGWMLISVLAAIAGAGAPFLYYAERHDRRRAAIENAMAEAIGQLRDAIRSGLSVQEALLGLARNGPEALRGEFTTLVREARLIGFEPALRAMRERLADPIFDIVAAALVLNDRVGGRNVTQVLDRLAIATRAQQRIQQEMRAHQARTVLSARIVAAVPVVVLFIIRWLSPEYLQLFDTWWGQVLLMGSLASVAVGYLVMRWVSRLPGEDRVLVQ
jgi:tight adherence protein B